MADPTDWCTIESDPGVFTELISEIGVKGVQVEELWAIDEESLAPLQPIYGLVFLFKWKGEADRRQVLSMEETSERGLFFANQVINNACATQAILGILLNHADIELGAHLSNFKEFTQMFPPDMKGLAISNSPEIRTAHNSFSRPEPFVKGKSVAAGKNDDVFHFISYVPIRGVLYELDGMKDGPIELGAYEDGNWLSVAVPAIQERIQRYSQSEIRFNLMAVIKDRRQQFAEKMATVDGQLMAARAKLQSLQDGGSDAMDVDEGAGALPDTAEELAQHVASLEAKQIQLKADAAEEDEKYKRWRTENQRRKHNYIPFIVNMLKYLAEKDQLLPLLEQAKAKRRSGAS